MFELKIVGAEEAAVLIGEGWPTRIVTLRAMSGDVVGAHHLYVVVDDVTIQILRATLSGVLLLLAFLCFRKGSTPSGGIRT